MIDELEAREPAEAPEIASEVPQRRKRRTKAEMEEFRRSQGGLQEIPVEIKRPTLTDPEKKGSRKRGPDLSVLVETTVVGLFGLVAVATAHEHWLKDRQDVMPITGPLNAWIDQLPSKTLKRLEKNLAPCLLVVGVATVIGPDLVVEIRTRDHEKRARNPVSQSQSRPSSSGPLHYPPAGSPVPAANGAVPATGTDGGWASSIPANGPRDAYGDVG